MQASREALRIGGAHLFLGVSTECLMDFREFVLRSLNQAPCFFLRLVAIPLQIQRRARQRDHRKNVPQFAGRLRLIVVGAHRSDSRRDAAVELRVR